MKLTKKLLLDSLKQTEKLFHKNELAYLALTSKIENPVRDRFAFNLHTKLRDDFIVSREWNRTDLAILKDCIPKVLIEFKAMYSFDALTPKNLSNYFEKVNKDLFKIKKYETKVSSSFFILLATHPHRSILSTYNKVVKYSYDINKSFKNLSDLEIKTITNSNVLNMFNELKCISSNEQ